MEFKKNKDVCLFLTNNLKNMQVGTYNVIEPTKK